MSRVYENVDAAFAEKCSNTTLYSHAVGFFKNLFEELIALAKKDNWLESFEKVPDEKKVTAVIENKTIMEGLKEVLSRVEPIYRGKDARISNEKRRAAETALKEGDLEKSLALACQAVLRSPMTGDEEVIDGGVSLALALWLRSDILLRLNRHRAALEDLKMALKERLPAKIRAQYYWRIGHCYKGIGETSRAKVSYEIANKLLGTDETARKQLHQDMNSLNYSVDPVNPADKSVISLTGGAVQSMPSLSQLIKITEDETKGRYAVANKHIRCGDVLLIDDPYAACLVPNLYGTHCLHCFKRLEDCEDTAPVWCPKCSGVAFCSIQCRDVAVSTYHTYECPFLGLFLGSGMSILSHIALRMVTQTDLDTNLLIHSKCLKNSESAIDAGSHKIPKKSKNKNRTDRLNRSKKGMDLLNRNIPMEDDEITTKLKDKQTCNEQLLHEATQVYKLCTHSRYRKGDDYLKRIVMAMFLTECLKRSDFFKDYNETKMEKVEILISELLVCNLQLLQFNAHEVYETVRGQHMFTGSKPLYTAVGIYPTGALFNHECCPSVARYFDGRSIVLRATRPLEPGEVVSEHYGPHFLMRNLEERQRNLACRYWFKCDCIACEEDWPTLKQMAITTPFLRCPNIGCSWKFIASTESMPAKCTKCSVPIDKDLVKIYLDTVNRCLEKYQEAAKLMDEQRPLDAVEVICEAIDQYHGVARMPHRETLIAQDSLRSCFATMGNVHIVKDSPQSKKTNTNN